VRQIEAVRMPLIDCARERGGAYACQSSPHRRRRAGRNRRGNSAGTSRRSEAAPIRTRFANRRHDIIDDRSRRRIAVRAPPSIYDQSFEHIYCIALALLLRLSEGTPRKKGTAARGVIPRDFQALVGAERAACARSRIDASRVYCGGHGNARLSDAAIASP
jgi:hypothetical protein